MLNIVRAWKDEAYRHSLSEAEQAALPLHPAGLVELTDGTVPIDIRRTATGLTVELRDVDLPERLQNKRDVNDFATPVTMITSRAAGNLTRLDIAARGRWFHQAHLANNQLVIEVKPIPTDDANKLVQSGQQGQRVSINFFGADATMVLRTLADISGKNVLIDPSLNGRLVTASLDNIPYDQALEIIMAQDFQDLTGQVIKKVVEMVQGLETQLLGLLLEAMPEQRKAEAPEGLLNGPVISSAGRGDVVTSQAQVDDLLESLGF